MKSDYKILSKLKHAAVAELGGCKIEILPNLDDDRLLLFRATPRRQALTAIDEFENGGTYLGRELLDTYCNLRRRVNEFQRFGATRTCPHKATAPKCISTQGKEGIHPVSGRFESQRRTEQ